MQGLLIINKPEGITSFGAVARVRRIAGIKRVGHTGTLDPMATGVLPIFLGRATSLCSFLLDADKTYTATILFGTVTDTLDVTGNVIEKREVNLTAEQVNAALENFIGVISQVPPAYSAIKKDGVPMYKLARKGESVDIPAREVTIHSISVESPYENGEITLKICCSKGTYIRSLCRDIGVHLGCGATLKALRRDATSGFTLRDSVNIDELSPDNLHSHLISEEAAVSHLRYINISEKQAVRFLNGGKLDIARLHFNVGENGEFLRVKRDDTLLGIGEVDKENNEIRIKCILQNA